MSLDLPENVTYNLREKDSLEIYVPYEIITIWNCQNCQVVLEAHILGENQRFEGIIKIQGAQSALWQSKLPKKEDRAREFLKETLEQRINKHKIGHKNA